MKIYRHIIFIIVITFSIWLVLIRGVLPKYILDRDMFYKRSNKGIMVLTEFKGYLYAGTWNDYKGCQLWRTKTGTTWLPVVTNGFGNPGNVELFCLQPFNNYLYAGGRNEQKGAYLCRSPDGTTWQLVMTDGFGSVRNMDIASLCQFKGHLYAGTRNEDSAELWKTHDGKIWTRVNIDNLTNKNNIVAVYCLYAHDGYLYIAPKARRTGTCIYRSKNGIDWEKVNISPTFFSVYNCIIKFKDYIYAGTKSDIQKKCGGIIRTNDGKNWAEIKNLPRKEQLKVDCLTVFNDELYSGIRYLPESGKEKIEIWRSSDGVNYNPAKSAICANRYNTLIDCLLEFKGYLYVGVWNESEGAQIWRTKNAEIWQRVL